MKLNQHPIISTDDVVTKSGRNLDTVIEQQNKEIAKLKSNLKWIYQNGGTGSGIGNGGSGGGGGGSNSWTINATLNNQYIKNGQTIILDGPGTYPLVVSISNPGGQPSFSLKGSYTTASGTRSFSNIVLDVSNSYEYRTSITLDKNDSLSLEVSDTYMVRKGMSVTYNTYSYVIDNDICVYTNPDNKTNIINNGDLYISDIREGFYMGVDYTMINACQDISYKWSISNNKQFNIPDSAFEEKHCDNLNSGTIAMFVPGSLINEAIAGNYKVSLDIIVHLQGSQPFSLPTKTVAFNIIPQGFYLKVEPFSGEIYKEQPAEADYDKLHGYTPGTVSFKLAWYEGMQQNQIESFTVTLDNKSATSNSVSVSMKDRVTTVANITVTEPGLHSITITGTRMQPIVRWFYVKKLESAIPDWFSGKSSGCLLATEYFRPDAISDAGTDADPNNRFGGRIIPNGYTFVQSPSHKDQVFTLKSSNILSGTPEHCHISFGLNYSDINADTEPIFTIECQGGYTMTVYRDHIQRGSGTNTHSIDAYIPVTRDFNPNTISSEWHMLDIVWRKLGGNEQNGKYEFVVYIDGVLDGCNMGTETIQKPTKITIHPVNVGVNLMEVSYYKDNILSEGTTSGGSYKFTDWEVTRHWYKYREYFGLSDEEKEKQCPAALMDVYQNFITDGKNVIIPSDVLTNMVQHNNKMPILVLKTTSTKDVNVYNWFTSSYSEGMMPDPIPCSVLYAKPEDSKLVEINPEQNNANGRWTIQPQGSSTLSYQIKNLTLAICQKEEDGRVPLFTPNFNKLDPTGPGSFYPEQSWVLKADVVDSSHSNNNAMGDFINENMTRYDMGGSAGPAPRNCLSGFPVLVVLGISPDATSTDITYYYLGIYNFNLGRDSKFNLGHADVKNIASLYNKPAHAGEDGQYKIENGMSVVSITNDENQYSSDFLIAEVSGNDKFYDFSQWDKSILFALPDAGDTTFMFDDVKTKLSKDYQESILQNFVKAVAKGGFYCFDYIGKRFNNSETGYDMKYSGYDTEYVVDEDGNPVYTDSTKTQQVINYYPNNTVPDFRTQYSRTMSNSVNKYSPKTKITDAITKSDLESLLNTYEEGTVQNQVILNMNSVVEYYVICMAFGLVDSVQKNMNVKTWDRGKNWYIAFYDMDTCLGVNNEGKPVNYFCFSDYWHGNSYKDEDTNFVKPGEIYVYRDYSPEGPLKPATFSGYDTPSSYLFAVAKYAAITQSASEDGWNFPSNVWADFRSKKPETTTQKTAIGSLESADDFIENYYKHHTANVDEFAWNLNYRSKYFIQVGKDDKIEFNNTNISKFNGRRIERVRNWLTGRFRLLDAYFNLPAKSTNIQVYDQESHEWHDYYAAGAGGTNTAVVEKLIDDKKLQEVKANPDVEILRDIFTQDSAGGKQYNVNLTTKIKTLPLSPLLISTSNKIIGRYLFEEGGDTEYEINIKTDGNQFLTLMGSSTWTYIQDMSAFMTNPMYVKSDYLQRIYASSSNTEINQWTFNVPNLRELTLSSANFKGEISNMVEVNKVQTNVFPNLQNIDISRSGISLALEQSNVINVTASNINANYMTLTNNSMLEKLTMTNARLNSFTLRPVPEGLYTSNTFTVPSTWNIKEMQIEGTATADTTGKTLSITNNNTLEVLRVAGFNEIKINNCPKLKSIVFIDVIENFGALKKLYVTNSGPNLDIENNKGIRICTNIMTDANIGVDQGIIYLRDFYNLKNISFGGTHGFDTVVLPGTQVNDISSSNTRFNDIKKYMTYDDTANKISTKAYYDMSEPFYAAQTNTAGIKLDKVNSVGAFSATNLKWLECRRKNHVKGTDLTITSNQAFFKTPYYKYTTSAGDRIPYTFDTTDLSNAFGCDVNQRANVMTITIMKAILNDALKDESHPERVTTLDSMFFGQNNVRPTSSTSDPGINLSKFTHCTTISNMFGYTGIVVLTKEMLSYGHSIAELNFSTPFYCQNQAGGTNIYILLDAFMDYTTNADGSKKYFIQKLKSIAMHCNDSATQYIPATLNGSTVVRVSTTDSAFDVKSIFTKIEGENWIVPSIVESFSGFDINSDYRIDVTQMFRGWTKLKTISWVFFSHDHAQGVWGLEQLLNYSATDEKLPVVENIQGCFRCNNIRTESDSARSYNGVPTDRVNIENMFDWDAVKNISDGITRYNQHDGGLSFSFPKKVYGIEKFNEIMNNYFGANRVKHVYRLFYNTHIIETSGTYDTPVKLYSADKTSNITYINGLFLNCKMYNKDTSKVAASQLNTQDGPKEQPINFDTSICKKLTNCKEFSYMFCGTYHLHAPVFDYFGRRYEVENKPTVYVGCEAFEQTITTETGVSQKVTRYKHTHKLKLVTFDYYQNITWMTYMFKDTRFLYKPDENIHPCFSIKSCLSDMLGTGASGFYNTETGAVYSKFAHLGNHLEDEKGRVVYCKKEIEDPSTGIITFTYYTTDGKIKYFGESEKTANPPEGAVFKHTELCQDYWSATGTDGKFPTQMDSAKTFKMSYEITDLTDVKTYYSETVYSPFGLKNWPVDAITDDSCKNQLILPPDFFYGLQSGSGNIEGVFYMQNYNTSEWCTHQLTGAVPRHLFNGKMNSITNMKSVLRETNVLPQYMLSLDGNSESKWAKYMHVYSYFPEYFGSKNNDSSAAISTAMDYAFCSKLFFPEAIDATTYNKGDVEVLPDNQFDIDYLVIFMSNSLGDNTQSLGNDNGYAALPYNSFLSGALRSSTNGWITSGSKYGNPANYTLSDSKIYINAMYNPSNGVGGFGFEQGKFGNKNLGFLFGHTLMNYYYGPLFSTGNVASIAQRTGFTRIAEFGRQGYADISAWMTLPKMSSRRENTFSFTPRAAVNTGEEKLHVCKNNFTSDTDITNYKDWYCQFGNLIYVES